MKIIVVGGGKVGTALCRSLVAENHDVILIEKDESVLNHITKRFDIIGILGNGANFKILEQADVEDCDIFISMTEYDEVNMVSAVLAKKMGAKETIVRVRNPEYSNSYFKEKNILGFSLVVNPELLTARYIANIIDFPNALSVEHFANGRVALMEFKIRPDSNLCNMSLSRLCRINPLPPLEIRRQQDKGFSKYLKENSFPLSACWNLFLMPQGNLRFFHLSVSSHNICVCSDCVL